MTSSAKPTRDKLRLTTLWMKLNNFRWHTLRTKMKSCTNFTRSLHTSMVDENNSDQNRRKREPQIRIALKQHWVNQPHDPGYRAGERSCNESARTGPHDPGYQLKESSNSTESARIGPDEPDFRRELRQLGAWKKFSLLGICLIWDQQRAYLTPSSRFRWSRLPSRRELKKHRM